MLTRLMLSLMMFSAAVMCTLARAQDFPNHPIKIVVPWSPGGNVDISARTR